MNLNYFILLNYLKIDQIKNLSMKIQNFLQVPLLILNREYFIKYTN